jgi:probable addiction module antidote protein
MKTDYAPLDIASYLDNEEVIAEYLSAAAEDEDPNVLLAAIANIAKARGMARVAQAAGLGRESLYKTLAPGSHPRFETVRAILRALNVEIAVRPPLTDKSDEIRVPSAWDKIKATRARKAPVKPKASAKSAKEPAPKRRA